MIIFRSKPILPFVSSEWSESRETNGPPSGRTETVRSGFTIIEVLLALAIAALVLMPIFILQGTIVQTVARKSKSMQRLLQAKQFLIDSSLARITDAQKTIAEKKLENPATILRYEYKKIAPESSLKKFKNLSQETVTLEWQDTKNKHRDRLITFVYNPESKST